MHFRNLRKASQDVFIDTPIDMDNEGNPLTVEDITLDETDLFDHVDLVLNSEQLYKVIQSDLSKRERDMLSKRYGLFGTKPLIKREIADKYGISRSYVSQHAYEKRVSKPA